VAGFTISRTFLALGVTPVLGLVKVSSLFGEFVMAGCAVGETVGLKLVLVYGLNLW
jgi:hypothetical protein